ncbi:MAG: winged helix-turn-helix domain-containing protein, partial [Chloroflexi bacterium]|nr:winged helix-turn-helix domain-containing protein [Chloroflexota bacterium]
MTNDLEPLRNSERVPLHAKAFKALEDWIRSGRFKPGEKLPSEDELSDRLGISRSTLREALGYLETHGLISRRQGIGTFVTHPYGTGLIGGLERLEPFRRV